MEQEANIKYPRKIKTKTIREAYTVLKKILTEHLPLEGCDFSTIAFEGTYPTNEKEVDAFVKDRIRIWLNSWIQGPIEEIIENFEKEANR